MNRILIAGFVLLLMAFRCHQEYPCAAGSYFFGVTGSFSPPSSAIAPGDTVFYESVFSKSLYDSLSGRTIDYSGSKGIEGSLAVYRIDTTRHRISTDSVQMRFVLLDGNSGQVSGSTQRFVYREDGTTYRVRLGILISMPGIYAVYAAGPGSGGLQGQDCGSAGFRLHVSPPASGIALFQQAMARPPGGGEEDLFVFRVQ